MLTFHWPEQVSNQSSGGQGCSRRRQGWRDLVSSSHDCCRPSLSLSLCLCRHFVLCLYFCLWFGSIRQPLSRSFSAEGLTWFGDRDEASRFLVCVCWGKIWGLLVTGTESSLSLLNREGQRDTDTEKVMTETDRREQILPHLC